MTGIHVLECIRSDGSFGHAIDLHVGNLIEPIWSYGESRARAGGDRQGSFGRDRAIASRGCRDGVRGQCERGADRVVGNHTAERIGSDGALRDAVDYTLETW